MKLLERFDPRAPARAARAPHKMPPPRDPLPPGGGSVIDPGNLMDLRRILAEDLATLQWDLGGLAYEMAIRDHFRLDVLIAQAAKLQNVDAELGVVEHLLRTEDGGAAGACPNCGTLYPRAASFCSSCGIQLMERAEIAQ